jgi:hypothetical protein
VVRENARDEKKKTKKKREKGKMEECGKNK